MFNCFYHVLYVCSCTVCVVFYEYYGLSCKYIYNPYCAIASIKRCFVLNVLSIINDIYDIYIYISIYIYILVNRPIFGHA